MPGDGELSEPENPEEGEEQAEEVKEESEEREKEASEETASAMKDLRSGATAVTVKIEISTMVTPAAERALEPKPVTDDLLTVKDPTEGAEEKKESTEDVEEVLEKAAGDEKMDVKKEGNMSKMALFLTAASLFGPQLKSVFEALVRAGKGEGIADLITNTLQAGALIAIAESLREEADEKYWADLAAFAKRLPATSADIVFFLQYQMLLTPLTKADDFAWNSYSDESKAVDELLKTYTDGGDDGRYDVLKALATVKYQGLEVPRTIAASLGQQAIARGLAMPKQTSAVPPAM